MCLVNKSLTNTHTTFFSEGVLRIPSCFYFNMNRSSRGQVAQAEGGKKNNKNKKNPNKPTNQKALRLNNVHNIISDPDTALRAEASNILTLCKKVSICKKHLVNDTGGLFLQRG